MEANDTIILRLIDNQFSVTVLSSMLIQVPFKWLKDAGVCYNIFFTELFSGVFF
jgi:hypothetical protein